jgi:hypothetical protein
VIPSIDLEDAAGFLGKFFNGEYLPKGEADLFQRLRADRRKAAEFVGILLAFQLLAVAFGYLALLVAHWR